MRPVITTDRCELRPYFAGMVTDDHVNWLNDPEVVRFSEQRHFIHSIGSVISYVNHMTGNACTPLWGIYAPRLIGTISAHIDEPNRTANIGILIGNKDYWRRGYAQEAWQAVSYYLFTKRNIRKIEAGCHGENRPMRNLALRCGMHLEGIRYDHFIVNGVPQDLLLYAQTKPDHVKVSVDEQRFGILERTSQTPRDRPQSNRPRLALPRARDSKHPPEPA